MTEEYYEIGPKLSDIDFYIGAEIIHINSFINTEVTASATKIINVSSSISIESSNSFSATKVTNVSSEVEIELITESVLADIYIPLAIVRIESSISISSSKKSFASSSASIESSISCSARKITETNSNISINLSGIFNLIKIAKASSTSNLSLTTSFPGGSTPVKALRHQFSILSRTIINPPIRFSPSYIDETSIRTLLILDGKPLTNHQRKLDISLVPNFVETVNWNNKKNRYYKRESTSGRRQFTIDWRDLPNAMDDTVDSRHGRDFLHSIAEDPDAHELKIINQNESGTTPYTESTYTVFVRDYSETLTRRYISEDVYLYECNLSLEEV
jgi:hypothetical protein